MDDENISSGEAPATLRISTADMVSMKVRIKKSGRQVSPLMLYQELPVRSAMTLFSTIPSGAFAVSLPCGNVYGRGYPVLASLPPVSDNCVIEYVRETNGRYEAQFVHTREGVFDIACFREIACRWVDRHEGRLVAGGRYAVIRPSITVWGTITRDQGYLALDPRHFSRNASPEFGADGRPLLNSHAVVRAPFFYGNRNSPEAFLPVFVKVEVKTGRNRDLHGAWIRFEEHMAIKTVKSRPPDAILPFFDEWLKRFADESGFDCWIFEPGMRFSARMEWWGDRNRRRTEHEGIDFAMGMIYGAGAGAVPEGTPVRAIADGRIVAILDDFLGKTIVVRHRGIADSDGNIFHTLLSHVQIEQCRRGPVSKGRILGRIGSAGKSRVQAHLHLTGAWIPEAYADDIRMEYINPAFEPVTLVDWNLLIRNSALCRLGESSD
ncbi:MAG TPA: M23 family metallopeptidase [Acidobacteriota bacterium]|nr:M23 family metallopeptidase [Acidobacteriota bacterium]